jgi:hypothetical protein
MRRLALALAAATMVAPSVPANAQRIYVRNGDSPWAAGPMYHYDNLDRTFYGGFSPPYARVIVVTPRARTYLYNGPPYYDGPPYRGPRRSGAVVRDGFTTPRGVGAPSLVGRPPGNFINPSNPQDRSGSSNPQDMTQPRAINPQDMRSR